MSRFASRAAFKILESSLAQSNAVMQEEKKRKARRSTHPGLLQHKPRIRQIRDALPHLTLAEIRRHRVPLHEALIAELQEDGYDNAAFFLNQLIDFQYRYRAEHSYDVIIMSRPELTACNDHLLHLYDRLQIAESAHNHGDLAGEIEELLRIACTYAFGPVDWWWLGEQFFAQCLQITQAVVEPGGYHYTMTYYLYGKYLIEQSKQIVLGSQFLNSAREASEGKEWTAGKVTGRIEKYIFVEVCKVLYEVLMLQAKAALRNQPALALELTLEARQRGVDACLPRADVLYLLGECERANQEPSKAVGYFLKAFLLYKTNKQMEQCCEAMIGLAMAYMEMGLLHQNREQLEKLLAFAQKEHLLSYVGQAYLYIGQYFLNAGTPESASPYLSNALNIFIDLNDVPRREFVKNLGAVSKGQETFDRYVTLILRCEDHMNAAKRCRNMMRLLNWKSSRVPFWEDMSETVSEVSLVAEEQSVQWGSMEMIHLQPEMEEEEMNEGEVEEESNTTVV